MDFLTIRAHPWGMSEDAKPPLDELETARALRDGLLTSPQRIGNMTLFAMRVTGTGLAYRASIDEYVWRDPALYLKADFLERCNGLPVILDHPADGRLNTDEYASRVIGAVFLPYLNPDAGEVWAIVRIHDAVAASAIERGEFSTSPSVIFGSEAGAGEKQPIGDGKTVLLENKPLLVDHLAVTTMSQGVWDRGRGPEGIRVDELRSDKFGRKIEMSEEDYKKRDDELSAKLDKMLAGFDSVCKRLDALEAKGEAPDEDDQDSTDLLRKVVDDAARKARDEKSGRATLRKAIDAIEAADVGFGDAQARADNAYRAIGKNAPPPMAGERILNYRKRLLEPLKYYAGEAYAKVSLKPLDPDALQVMETAIYDAAVKYDPPIPAGQLRKITRRSDSGHVIHEYVGDWRDANRGLIQPLPKVGELRRRTA
jgi:colicin import membrane protein